MREGKRKILLYMTGIIIAVSTVGCTEIAPSSPEDGYNTYYPMSVVEYTIFMSKQITVAENILFTRISMTDVVQDNTYSVSSEVTNTEEAISKLKAIRDETSMTMPAKTYETDHQNTLSLMNEAVSALEIYLSTLENGEDLNSCSEVIKASYLALSGEANIYYE